MAVAAGAASGAKLKTASDTATLEGAGGVGSATAVCEAPAKAVSGGFESSDAVTAGALPLDSLRTGKRAWVTRGQNFSADPQPLTSFAYCRAQKKLKTVTETETLSPGAGTRTVEATCPAGTKAISGGFAVGRESGPGHLPFASYKSGKRSWAVSTEHLVGSESLSAQVNCRKGRKVKTEQVTQTIDQSPDSEEIVVSCRAKRRLISGGFASEDPINDGGPFFHASRRENRKTWLVSAASGSATVTAYAYCEKKKPPK
jgi:hypothetical protein